MAWAFEAPEYGAWQHARAAKKAKSELKLFGNSLFELGLNMFPLGVCHAYLLYNLIILSLHFLLFIILHTLKNLRQMVPSCCRVKDGPLACPIITCVHKG